MNSEKPYGAWNRTYYLGEGLSKSAQVIQLGYNTSVVDYCQTVSTRSKSIPTYVRAIRSVLDEFIPQIVYAHETLPALAAYLGILNTKKSVSLVFDIHALHAAEYKSTLNYSNNKLLGYYLFSKAYFPQKFIVRQGKTLIAASSELKQMLLEWYKIDEELIKVVPNGATLDLFIKEVKSENPYPKGMKIALLIAPNNNILNRIAVKFILDVANILQNSPNGKNIQIAIVGGGWQKNEIEIFPNIKYYGFVSDLNMYIDNADVCLLPYPDEAICGGARTKAFDFLIRGRCILSTPEGMRGLREFENNTHILLSNNNPESYANHLEEIILNADEYETYQQNAHILIKNKYNWQHLSGEVLSIFNDLIS